MGEKKKYTVAYTVRGRFYAEVEAESFEEAKEKAENEFCEADFEDLIDAEGKILWTKDESDQYEWEL